MVEELEAEVQLRADEMSDVVFRELFLKLQKDKLLCHKHTQLMWAASNAALALRRWERRFAHKDYYGRNICDPYSQPEHLRHERERTSKAFHDAACTCGLTRKERHTGISVGCPTCGDISCDKWTCINERLEQKGPRS